jgi:hypothetical protein
MRDHEAVMIAIAVGSVVAFIVGLLIASWAVVRMPADALLEDAAHHDDHPVRKVVRNVIGWVIIVIGIALLVLPGQGLITIALGMMLVDFPRKRQLILWVLARGSIHRTIDRLRARKGRPPLHLPSDD